MEMSSRLIPVLQSPDPDVLRAELAENVSFHSPVTDYRGRDDVVHILSTVAGVLDDLRVKTELHGDAQTTAFVEARVGDERLDGVLDERYDAQGRIAEITLLLRPLAALSAAIDRMRAALATSPPPGYSRLRER